MSDEALKKILIVDDDAVVLRTMKDGLSAHYKIFGANSGANALKVLEKIPADLILLDYEMPEMSGPEVLKAVRGNPATAQIPVLFLTGLAEGELNLGDLDASGLLRKSMPMEEIISRISAFFDQV